MALGARGRNGGPALSRVTAAHNLERGHVILTSMNRLFKYMILYFLFNMGAKSWCWNERTNHLKILIEVLIEVIQTIFNYKSIQNKVILLNMCKFVIIVSKWIFSPHRNAPHGLDCPGLGTEQRDCNTDKCPGMY